MTARREVRVFRRRAEAFGAEVTVCHRLLGMRGALSVLSNRLTGYPEQLVLNAKDLRHPLSFRVRTSDAEVYGEVFLGREYDFPVSFFPRTIVDVGANCGITSIFYANRYPDATVVAVEAETSNYAALLNNTRAYSNIVPVHAALWHTDGQVEVFPPWPRWKSWGKWGFRVREGSGCPALTLPTLMRDIGIETVDILKIDVEGAEREIFSTCTWMDKVRVLAIELHDRDVPGCSDAVNSVTGDFQKIERGMVTFYSRPDQDMRAVLAG
jgi:FkbM family methyltransferase